jgi:hypothetical protein
MAPTTSVSDTADGLVLQQDLLAQSATDCRTPGSGSGAAWQNGLVTIAGVDHPGAVYCYMPEGGTGSLDFLLGRRYTKLDLVIGVADDSSSSQRLEFEIVADGVSYLTPVALLQAAEQRELMLNVTDVNRLTLRVNEVGEAEDDGRLSRPSFADAVVRP